MHYFLPEVESTSLDTAWNEVSKAGYDRKRRALHYILPEVESTTLDIARSKEHNAEYARKWRALHYILPKWRVQHWILPKVKSTTLNTPENEEHCNTSYLKWRAQHWISPEHESTALNTIGREHSNGYKRKRRIHYWILLKNWAKHWIPPEEESTRLDHIGKESVTLYLARSGEDSIWLPQKRKGLHPTKDESRALDLAQTGEQRTAFHPKTQLERTEYILESKPECDRSTKNS